MIKLKTNRYLNKYWTWLINKEVWIISTTLKYHFTLLENSNINKPEYKFNDDFTPPVVCIAPSRSMKVTSKGEVFMWIIGWFTQVETGLRTSDYKSHVWAELLCQTDIVLYRLLMTYCCTHRLMLSQSSSDKLSYTVNGN